MSKVIATDRPAPEPIKANNTLVIALVVVIVMIVIVAGIIIISQRKKIKALTFPTNG